MKSINANEPLLKVKVISPTNTFYNGRAVSVSANNDVGPFDVLAGHANFFSLLPETQVVVSNGIQNFTFPIAKGMIKVKDNDVILLVDIEPAYLQANKAK